MIFLTIGTHEPFDRLVRCVDEWCGLRGSKVNVFGQITDRGDYAPQHFQAVASLAPADYAKQFDAAEFIVSHAGMGSIITALSKQKPIVVLPRRGHLRETRNDHQFATVQHFKDWPGIFAAEDEADLVTYLDQIAEGQAAKSHKISPFAEDNLLETLRGFIHAGKQ